MSRLLCAACLAVLLLPSVPASAQNPLVGTWERTYQAVDGKEVTPPAPTGQKRPGVLHTIYGADGHYIQLTVPSGRAPIDKALKDWSKEDWAEQYGGVYGQYGTHSVSGDKLSLKPLAAVSRAAEGNNRVLTFRMEGDTLTTIRKDPNQTVENRYRRVK